MANIPINDTHRLPYMKGEFTAIKLGAGATTPVMFYDADGDELGYKIYTNAEGFVCDANGNLLGNGVFVHVDSVISAHYNGNRFSQWVAKGYDSGNTVNDGKMLNAEGQEIWSANSPRNYTLQWSDIAGKPQLNNWSEDEQVVVITVNSQENPLDSVSVNKFTKIMTIGYAESLSEGGTANLVLVPQSSEQQRFGQVIFVQSTSSKFKKLQLWNNGEGTPFCVIPAGGNALVALLSNGKFVCLNIGASTGSGENYQIGIVVCNQQTFIDNSTPGVIIVNDIADGGSTAYQRVAINAETLASAQRKIIMLWQPSPEFDNSAKKLRVFGSVTSMMMGTPHIFELLPFRACEVLVSYDQSAQTTNAIPLGFTDTSKTPVAMQSPTILSNDGVANAVLKSAATVIDLALTGGSTPTPETKKVFPVRIELPPNYEGDITVMNTLPLAHLTNFEIHVGFKSVQQNLTPGFQYQDNPLNLNSLMVKVYRSSDSHGANKGKFFAMFHVVSLASGGMFVCYNPDTSDT